MKGFRGLVAVIALLALPLVAVHAQGRGKGPRRNADVCASPAGNSGHVPYGQAKKCPPPPPNDSTPQPPDTTPPPPSGPPTGIDLANGKVFADLDGDGVLNLFVGDTVLAGVPVELRWNGQSLGTSVTDANGFYSFSGLAANTTYEMCVTVPSGFTQSPAPASMPYNGCGGTGYSFSVNTTIQTTTVLNFGMIPQ